MPKIVSYRVKCKTIRDGRDVKLELDETDKKEQGSKEISLEDSKAILNIAKEIADENNKNLSLKKKVLFSSEDEVEGYVIMKYLEE